MRTIVITHDGFWYTIEDWNFARWKLYESTQGRYYCDMHGIKVTFESVEHFLELMYGHSRVGEFVNYEIKIKESGIVTIFVFLPFTIQHGSPAITAGLPISPV